MATVILVSTLKKVRRDLSCLKQDNEFLRAAVSALMVKVDQLGQRLQIVGEELMAKGDATLGALAQIDALTNQIKGTVDQVIVNENNQTALIAALRAQVAGNAAAEQLLDQLDANAPGRVAALQAVSDLLGPLASDPTNPVPDPTPELPDPGTGTEEPGTEEPETPGEESPENPGSGGTEG